jgi:hypothetical protein
METPLSETDFYDVHPSVEHRTGDIWSDLPSFGALPCGFVSGLVITPACDLANWKVDTITYIPVVSLRTFFTTRLSLQRIKDEVSSQLDTAGFSTILDIPPGYISPRIEELRAARTHLRNESSNAALGKKQREAIERAINGLIVLGNIAANTPDPGDFSRVQGLFAKQFREWHSRILRNAVSDVHFLPADRQRAEWSAIPVHSVALFHYPLSLPIAVLELAQQHYAAAWDSIRQAHAQGFPCLSHMTRRPIKKALLRHRFVVDVIARLTNMFGRLGSPDFTTHTLERFMQDDLS